MTPSPAVTTISRRRPDRRALYGRKSGPIRRRFARRLAGSAGRSGSSLDEWKYMPIAPGYAPALPRAARGPAAGTR